MLNPHNRVHDWWGDAGPEDLEKGKTDSFSNMGADYKKSVWILRIWISAVLYCSLQQHLWLSWNKSLRVTSLNLWIPPTAYVSRFSSIKWIRASTVLFLWLQSSHKFWSCSIVNFHILHGTLWPHSALHHLVRPLVKIQGLGLWHNIFSWSVHPWHHLGIAYWNRRFHPTQSRGYSLTPK